MECSKKVSNVSNHRCCLKIVAIICIVKEHVEKLGNAN